MQHCLHEVKSTAWVSCNTDLLLCWMILNRENQLLQDTMLWAKGLTCGCNQGSIDWGSWVGPLGWERFSVGSVFWQVIWCLLARNVFTCRAALGGSGSQQMEQILPAVPCTRSLSRWDPKLDVKAWVVCHTTSPVPTRSCCLSCPHSLVILEMPGRNPGALQTSGGSGWAPLSTMATGGYETSICRIREEKQGENSCFLRFCKHHS